MSIWGELRRRHVFRVAVVYAVIAWLLAQVAALAFPVLLLPDWILRAFVALLILGFPVALVLAWAYEITPQGIMRAMPVPAAGTLVDSETTTAPEPGSGGRPGAAPSIAVLPFEEMSGDKENEYFGDGLAEEIINVLARIRGVKVIARTSAFAFKGKHEDIRRIGEALGVTNILEGSVRKSGSRIRVTAQLIEVRDGSHLWSERYDRTLSDVFAVQDEIAAAIVRALEVTLSGEPLSRRHVPDIAAYECYLKGLYHSQRWTPESLARAEAHFERAIALDSRYALAHAELAHSFLRRAIFGIMPPRDALPTVRSEAERALAIDPALPEAYAMLGTTAALFEYDWAEAERAFSKAISFETVPPTVHRYYAHYCLFPTSRFEEAVRHFTLAVNDDPLELTARAERSICMRAASMNDESDAELRQILELDEKYWFPYFVLGVNHALDGRDREAREMAERASQLAPWFLPNVGLRAALLARAGETQRVEELMGPYLTTDEYVDPIGPAMFYLLCGNLDTAADWVEKAIDQRQPAIFFFLYMHAKALQTTPRWARLERLMNLGAAG